MATSITGLANSIFSRTISLALGAQGVTGGGVLEADASDDVAGGSVVTVDTLGGVHLEDAAEALALTVGSVDHVGAGLGAAGVNAT